MNEVVATAAALVATAGLVVSTLVLLATRRLVVAVPVLLDFLLAAGLLRLGADLAWPAIGAAATVVVLRRLLSASLRQPALA